MNFDHLSPRARIVAAQGVAERLAYLRTTPILPIQPLSIIEGWLRGEITAAPQSPTKPVSVLLSPHGMGVSEMIRRVCEASPPQPSTDPRIMGAPVVCAHLPPSGSLNEIGREVCGLIGAPLHAIGGKSPNAIGWLDLLRRTGTRMLILDDMQALNVLPKTQQGPLLNLVRTAVSRYDLQVVLIGSPKLRPLLMADEQLSERTQLIEVQPFKAGDPALTAFLEAFTRWCPLQRDSDL